MSVNDKVAPVRGPTPAIFFEALCITCQESQKFSRDFHWLRALRADPEATDKRSTILVVGFVWKAFPRTLRARTSRIWLRR
jgi:hypothetical protein